jgi:hypothetical protein
MVLLISMPAVLQSNCRKGMRRPNSAYPQLIDPFEDCAALAADDGVAIPTDQWICNGFGAGGTIEVGERDGFGHAVSIIPQPSGADLQVCAGPPGPALPCETALLGGSGDPPQELTNLRTACLAGTGWLGANVPCRAMPATGVEAASVVWHGRRAPGGRSSRTLQHGRFFQHAALGEALRIQVPGVE